MCQWIIRRQCQCYVQYYNNCSVIYLNCLEIYCDKPLLTGLLLLYTLYHATATAFGDDLICYEISVHILYIKHRSVFTSCIWYKQRIVRGVLQSNRFDWLIAVSNCIQVDNIHRQSCPSILYYP